MTQRSLLWTLFVALTPLVACADGDAEPAPTYDGPSVAIDVAALNLEGVGDVVWDLQVDNGADQVVFQRRISSGAYGDGGGSAS